jgi:hypothetical protein
VKIPAFGRGRGSSESPNFQKFFSVLYGSAGLLCTGSGTPGLALSFSFTANLMILRIRAAGLRIVGQGKAQPLFVAEPESACCRSLSRSRRVTTGVVAQDFRRIEHLEPARFDLKVWKTNTPNNKRSLNSNPLSAW